MPIPFALLYLTGAGAATAAPITLTEFAVITTTVLGGVAIFGRPEPKPRELPKFKDTAKAMTKDRNVDAGALLVKLDGQASHDETQSNNNHERTSEMLTRMESGLTALEGRNEALREVESFYSSQEPYDHEALQTVTTNTIQQQLDIESINTSLLPALLKSHRDKQMLMAEIEQLKSEASGLKSGNKELKRQVSELSSSLDEALVLTEDTLADNDALRHQLSLANESNHGSMANLGLGLFRS